jgi:hypothetical protein
MYTGCHIVTKLHHHVITWFDAYIYYIDDKYMNHAN